MTQKPAHQKRRQSQQNTAFGNIKNRFEPRRCLVKFAQARRQRTRRLTGRHAHELAPRADVRRELLDEDARRRSAAQPDDALMRKFLDGRTRSSPFGLVDTAADVQDGAHIAPTLELFSSGYAGR